MSKPRFPSSSFGTVVHSVLREGANRTVKMKFDTERLATRFAQRVNMLRAAMKREDHPDWEQLYRCGVHREPGAPNILIFSPRDSEFAETARAAGIKVEEPEVFEFDIP